MPQITTPWGVPILTWLRVGCCQYFWNSWAFARPSFISEKVYLLPYTFHYPWLYLKLDEILRLLFWHRHQCICLFSAYEKLHKEQDTTISIIPCILALFFSDVISLHDIMDWKKCNTLDTCFRDHCTYLSTYSTMPYCWQSKRTGHYIDLYTPYHVFILNQLITGV